jgi:hypothetical protein
MFDFPEREHDEPLDPPRSIQIDAEGHAKFELIARLPDGVATAKLANFMELEHAVLVQSRPREVVFHCGESCQGWWRDAALSPVEVILRIQGKPQSLRGDVHVSVSLAPTTKNASTDILKVRYRGILNSLKQSLLATDVDRREECRLRTDFPVRIWTLDSLEDSPADEAFVIGKGEDVCAGGISILSPKPLDSPYVFVEFDVPATRQHAHSKAVVVSRGPEKVTGRQYHLAFQDS